jgi:hypothetical protein
MWTRVRWVLWFATTATAATVVTASVRVGLAEAEFAKCEARWSEAAVALRDDAVARELAGLDRRLEAALEGADLAIFAPWRWASERRAGLAADVARFEPLASDLVAFLEAPRTRERLREPSQPRRHPKLAIGRSWTNLLVARAVLADDDREAATWIARSLDTNDLRCGTSTIGVMMHCAFDAITMSALRERTASTAFDPKPYLELVDPRLARRDTEVPWRDLGRAEATLFVFGASDPARDSCGDPTAWWGRADGLNVMSATVHHFEAIADGAVPEPTEFMPTMIFDGLVTTRRLAGERAALARAALRVAEFEREHGRLPETLVGLDAELSTRRLRYELDGERAVLETPSHPPMGVIAPPVERWTIARR